MNTCSAGRGINCQNSTNWAGVADFNHNYTSVQGGWRESCNPVSPGSSVVGSLDSSWIGLGPSEYPDSNPNAALVQAVVRRYIDTDGTTKFKPLVESYVPQGKDMFGRDRFTDYQHAVDLSINCGDQVWMYVSSIPTQPGSDFYYIQDETSGGYYTTSNDANNVDTVIYTEASSMPTHVNENETAYPVIGGFSPAEWVVERPGGYGGAPLYNFGQVYFSQAYAAATDVNPGWGESAGQGQWTTYTMCSTDNNGVTDCANSGTLANVCARVEDLPSLGSGTAFDVEWYYSGENIGTSSVSYHGG